MFEITLKLAEQAKDKILAGGDAASMVSKSVTLEKPVTLKRTDNDKLSPTALKLAFEMPHPGDGKPGAAVATLDSNDIAVVILQKVTTPDKVDQSQIDALKGQRINDIATSEYDAALAEISANYEIRKNPKALE